MPFILEDMGAMYIFPGICSCERIQYNTLFTRKYVAVICSVIPLDLQSKNKGREIIPTFVSVNQRREVNYVSY